MSQSVKGPSTASPGAAAPHGHTPFIADIERATLASVPPDAMEEAQGWLLGYDPGSVGRAHSAVPLAHGEPDLGAIAWAESRFAAHGRPTVFRLPRVASFDAFRARLIAGGYAESSPTMVQTARLADVAANVAHVPTAAVNLSEQPHEQWASVFLGPGLDPADGAHRVRILGRSTCTRFATISPEGSAVAVGAGSLAHGYLGIHGMRTLAPWRGRGMARQIIAALVRAAQAQGLERVYLQVELGNDLARSLYRRLGLADAWAYAYWKRPATA